LGRNNQNGKVHVGIAMSPAIIRQQQPMISLTNDLVKDCTIATG
jgi:hypothetical protein